MDTLKRRTAVGVGGWVEIGTAKKNAVSLDNKLRASLRWEGLRWLIGARGWREVHSPGASHPGTLLIPLKGIATAPPRATIRFAPHHLVAVLSLSGRFCSRAAGFFAGQNLLQKQDPVLSSPKRGVGGRCPLSLMTQKCCSLSAQGHGEASSKGLSPELIMI